ncbi:MAG: hypothetical protein ICV75_04380 [Nitrospiraceae bacterium]|nr:hypothetical protein [Nitrospiraceae bacterium]
MTSHRPAGASIAATTEASRNAKVRRFASGVTVVLIVFCNAVFLVGMRVSGVNLDDLVKTPDVFNPKSDICLRLTWQRLAGAPDPVRLCSEWINLSDTTGKPHQLDQNTKVKQGPDGQYYIDQVVQADYRLLAFVGFVAAVLLSGVLIRRYVVSRYRLQLERTAIRQ